MFIIVADQLYEDFMARSSTRAALSSGSVIGMMGILMKLRKVCAHGLLLISVFGVMTCTPFYPGVQPSRPFRAAIDSNATSYTRPQHFRASSRVLTQTARRHRDTKLACR